MTNFKQHVTMRCSKEQYKNDLEKECLKLYEVSLLHTTNVDGLLGMVSNHYNVMYQEPYFIDHYNPELFLAIAGMREGEELHVGEWMMCIEDIERSLNRSKKGDLVPVKLITDTIFGHGHFSQRYDRDYFRKATISELITHFTKKDMGADNTFGETNFNPQTMYTLEDLREGKVACVNDGTLEELRKVLEYCFPEDRQVVMAGTINYIRSERYPLKWTGSLATDLPTQSVKLFHSQLPKEHEFKFGDKVLAWDFDGATKYDYIFVAKIDSEFPYLLADSESWFNNFKIGKGGELAQRKYITLFPEPLKITRSEIAKKFGVEDFVIVND